MTAHLERMKNEELELKDKCVALGGFISENEIFKSLNEAEKVRMIKQHAYMESYHEVLCQRIAAAML